MKYLRCRRGLHHLHVVVGRQLQKALEPRRRVLGTLTFVAMRQHQRQARLAAPLHFAGGNELINDYLRAVDEVAELRLPYHQRVRLGARVAILEGEHRFFRKHRVDDREWSLPIGDVFERRIAAFVELFAVLIMQHRVPMRERATRSVLPGDAYRVTARQQCRIGQMLGHAPVERQLAFGHRAAICKNLFHQRSAA